MGESVSVGGRGGGGSNGDGSTSGSGGGSGGFGGGGGGSGWGGGSGSSGSGGRRVGAVPRGGFGGGQRQQQQHRSETPSPQQLREWFAQHGASEGSVRCPYVIRMGDRAGQPCGKHHSQHRCFSRLEDAWRPEFDDEAECPRWAELLRHEVDIFALDYDAILAAMYALSVSAEGDCYLCVPPDPGIEVAILGASESALLGGPVLACSSTVLPCPAVLPGSLSGLHLPSFSTNLVSTPALQDAMVSTTTPGGQRVSICTCTRTGRRLATFTRRLGSSLYSLTTKPPQVAASAQVSTSGPVAPPCSCRFLSHQNLLWHHRLGELSSNLLREFCRGDGILNSFMLLASPQKNGIAECRIGLVMEVARTSMIHAAAPHFLWPFALFLAPGPPPVDLHPPQGPAPSGVSQVDPLPLAVPVEVAVDSGAARGAASGGAVSGGTEHVRAEPGGAELAGADPRGAESEGADSRGAEPGGAEPGGTDLEGAAPGGTGSEGAESGGAEPQGTASAGGAGPGGARTRGTGAAGAGGVGGAGAADPGTGGARAGGTGDGGTRAGGAGAGGTGAGGTRAGGAEAGGTRAGGAGASATGAGGTGTGGVGTGGAGAGGTGAGGAGAGGTGAGGTGAGGTSVLSLSLVLPRLFAQLAKRRAPASRPASPARPACTSRRTSRPRPPAVPGTHQMALRPSTAPLRVPLPSPPASSLPTFPDPESDSLRAASPTVARFLDTVVTDPSLASTAASALVAELVDIAARCRLDYAASLVAESASVCPPSVGGFPTSRKSRPAALRVAPCCSPRIALCCSARRALLQPVRRALLPHTSRPAAARASRSAAPSDAPCCSPQVAPCFSPQVAPCCPACRALLQPARRALLLRASRPTAARMSRSAAPRVMPCCSPRVAPCCPAQRAPCCPCRPGRAAPPSPSRHTATTAAAAARASAAAGGATAADGGGAVGSAGGAAGAGGAGGAAGSTGGAAGAGGAGPTTDRHYLSWPLSRQLQWLGMDSSGHCLSRTTPPLSSFRCVPGHVEAAYLGSSESAAAPGASESAAALGARESADALGQVAASSRLSASGRLAASCSCRVLSHQTLLWHHLLGHPSLPCLRSMHSRLLVSGLPRSLPSLLRSPALLCLPCVEGRHRAAPHSSEFPPTTAPLQTLHMDVWGPAPIGGTNQELYFILIHATHRQLRKRFRRDFPVMRLHCDRGGEFSFDLLADFCKDEGILQSFTLPTSPQQNGIAEHRIGLFMEVARTSMIHAAAPHFLWPFAIQYAAHHLKFWLHVTLTSLVLLPQGGDPTADDTGTTRRSPRLETPPGFPPRPSSPPPQRAAVDSGAETAGAEPGGAEREGEGSRGAATGGAATRGPGAGQPPQPDLLETLSLQAIRAWIVRRGKPGGGGYGPVGVGADSPGGTAGAGGIGGTAGGAGGAASAGGTRSAAGTRGAGATGPRGATGAGGAGPTSPGGTAGAGGAGGAAGARGTGDGGTRGAGAAGPGGSRTRGAGAVGAGGAAGAGGAGGANGAAGTGGARGTADARGAGAAGARGAAGAGGSTGAAGAAAAGGAELLVLSLPSSTGLTPPLPCPPSYQSQPQLLPGSPLPAPAPHTEVTESLTERREPETCAFTPVRARRVARPCPPAVLGTHGMALGPSSVPQRVVRPEPPASSLLHVLLPVKKSKASLGWITKSPHILSTSKWPQGQFTCRVI
ncbi:unnamed protein product [Closterium sp. NIES-54]